MLRHGRVTTPLDHIQCKSNKHIISIHQQTMFLQVFLQSWPSVIFFTQSIHVTHARPNLPLSSSTHIKKGGFYIAQYPVRWTAQIALHFLPSLTDLFIPTPFSASPGSILAMQQLRTTTKSLTFPPLSISQVLIYKLTAESTGASMERRKMPNLPNGSKGGFEPGLT